MNIANFKDKLYLSVIYLILILFILPNKILAADIKLDSLDNLQATIDSANDGDRIDFVDLFAKNDSSANDAKEKTFNVNKNITITSSGPEYGAYKKPRAVCIDNINFNIEAGNTLSLNGFLYLRGGSSKPVFSGGGSLYINDKCHIEAKNGNPAINLPNGSVKIENVMSYGGEKTINSYIKSLSYSSEILGGNSKAKNGASAIIAKDIDILQPNLEAFDSHTSRGILIRGGHALNENMQGGFALEGDHIKVDLSGEKNDSASDPNIVGGSGGYGQGAIKGKDIDILSAGNQKIQPGNGISLDVNPDKIDNFYHGLIIVEDGGHLVFGSKDLGDPRKYNSLQGFDSSVVFCGSDDEASAFFKDKKWTNFYGPSIWARGNARVDIKSGKFFGLGANPTGPSSDKYFMHKLPIEPIIKMESGLLNIGEAGQESEISIGGSNHYFNTSPSIISSKGDINVYGNKTEIKGPNFTTENINGIKNGYITNPIAPKTGSSAIETSGRVLIDGASVIGGGLENIDSTDENLRNQYRLGSGIVGASELIIRNNALVQGRGAIEYTRYGLKQGYINAYNISAGHGLENVGSVFISNSEVHGGDVNTVRTNCGANGLCLVGTGKAGSAIKAAKEIQIGGSSLITGGSSVGIIGSFNFSDRMPAGHGIDGLDDKGNIVTDSLIISDDIQIYGGGSSTKAGHAIANVKNVFVDGNSSAQATIFGGGCRNTSNTGEESAGSGLYNVGNATIKAGKIEAGNKLYQTYIPKYEEKMHYKTKSAGYVGTSNEASAIVARGKVIIDGTDSNTPYVKSYYYKSSWLGEPIASISLADTGSLYVGKAKVYSGVSERPNSKNILVKGGKYHVDILKENYINSYEEKYSEKDGSFAGLKYRHDNSLPLYRILEKSKNGYTDLDSENLKASPAYDDVFFGDLKIQLYRGNLDLSEKVGQEGFLRKDLDQAGATKLIPNVAKVSLMPTDNIVTTQTFSIIYDNNLPGDAVVEVFADPPKDENIYKLGEKAGILELGKLSLKNYNFLGWNTQSDGNGVSYKPGEFVSMDSNLVLYAVWKVEETNIIPQKDNDKPLFPWLEIGNYESYDADKKENILIHKAYIFGYPDKSVRPNGNITRAEAAALAIRLAGLEANDKASRFKDSEEEAWYNPYINLAFDRDMLLANENKIRPNENITRAEFAKLISSLDEDKTKELPFSDTKGHQFEKEIARAYANNRINGYPDNTFRPDSDITRAEAVKILNSLFERLADKTYIDNNQDKLKVFTDLNRNDWFYYEVVEAANNHEFTRKENTLDESWKLIIQD